MIHLKQTEFYQDWVERSSQLIRVLSHKTICHCVASSPVFFRNYKALGQAVCEICCVYCVYTRNFNNAQLSWAWGKTRSGSPIVKEILYIPTCTLCENFNVLEQTVFEIQCVYLGQLDNTQLICSSLNKYWT